MCPKGFEYQECGTPCPQTCRNLNGPSGDMCEAMPCVEGCFCPEGTINHGENMQKSFVTKKSLNVRFSLP